MFCLFYFHTVNLELSILKNLYFSDKTFILQGKNLYFSDKTFISETKTFKKRPLFLKIRVDGLVLLLLYQIGPIHTVRQASTNKCQLSVTQVGLHCVCDVIHTKC